MSGHKPIGEYTIKEINRVIDDAIYKAVLETEITIDKKELIKALKYDRGQYKKGWNDAIDEFYKGLLDLLDDEDRYGYLSIGDIKEVYNKLLKEQGEIK